MLLQKMIERCDLNAVSQGILASGPGYTYCSGNVKTTVDYILMDIKAASMMTSCCTHPMEDLNTSDHLPLTVSLSNDVCSDGNTPGSSSYKKIDWLGAEKNGDLAAFSAEITSRLETLYNRVYDDARSISSEIEQVASILKETADRLLPSIEPRRKKRWRDDTLSCLRAQARLVWKSAGLPTEGPLFDEKIRLRSAVRKRVRWCAAKAERLRHQRRDRVFATQDSRRFMTPQRRKARCSKLVIGGETVQDSETLLKIWAGHFGPY